MDRLFVSPSDILYIGSDGVSSEPHAQSVPQITRSDIVLLLIPHSFVRHVFRTLDRSVLPLLAQIHAYLQCGGYVGIVCDPIPVLGTGLRFGGFGTDGEGV